MPTYAPLGTASFTIATPTFNYALLSDGDDVVSRIGTVASGIGVLKRGTIVNFVPATGVITVPTTAAGCNGILVDDIDATSATVQAGVYVSGKVKADALTWPTALAHGDVADALRDFGILVESVVFTDGSMVKSFPTEAEAAEAQKNLDRVRQLAKDAEKKAEEAKQDEPPPSDSPWAYLTDDEKEKTPGLATDALTQAAADREEKKAEEEQRPSNPPPHQAPPTHQPQPTPPHKPVEPPKPDEKHKR